MAGDVLYQDFYEFQVGLKASGYDPGPLDGMPGPKSRSAALGMFTGGSSTGSRWGIFEIEEGLRDSGWLVKEAVDYVWDERSHLALGNFIRANFSRRASFVPEDSGWPAVALGKPQLASVSEEQRIMQGSRVVDTLFLHTAATPGHWWKGKTLEDMRAEIDRWHRARGFGNGFGYHRLYHPDGSRIEGRPETQVGAHVKGHNTGSLGWCMVPVVTITAMGQPLTHYTPETLNAVRDDILVLAGRTPLRRIAGHNEEANKLCPGHVVDIGFYAPGLIN